MYLSDYIPTDHGNRKKQSQKSSVRPPTVSKQMMVLFTEGIVGICFILQTHEQWIWPANQHLRQRLMLISKIKQLPMMHVHQIHLLKQVAELLRNGNDTLKYAKNEL